MRLLLRPADLLRVRELVSSMEQCTPKLQGQVVSYKDMDHENGLNLKLFSLL